MRNEMKELLNCERRRLRMLHEHVRSAEARIAELETLTGQMDVLRTSEATHVSRLLQYKAEIAPANQKEQCARFDVVHASPETAITEQQLADLLGITLITATQNRHSAKNWPPHFKVGRLIRYRLGDVLAWRDKQTRKGR